LTGPFLSAGKGVLRYSVPKWLTFLNFMWGVVFTACVVFLFLHIEVGKLAGGALCEGIQGVHADSPAKCVPHPEQSASHICHIS